MVLKASDQGLEIADVLRRKKSWLKGSPEWASQANVSVKTLKRFWQQVPIQNENFQAICQVVGVQSWHDIVDCQNNPCLPEVISGGASYIGRPPLEDLCFRKILQPGALIRIKAPRKMGKTRLIQKIFNYAEHHNYATASLNLLEIETSVLTDLEKFLQWFCRKLSRRLDLDASVAELWDPDFSSNDNCTAYLEDSILAQLDTPLVLGLDNVDCLFQYPVVASDFLRLLRSWHDEAKTYPLLKKLRLVISHSTEVYIPLDVHCSPFNVGCPVELPEFTPAQVLSFTQRYGFEWPSSQIGQLIHLVGGHPYLVQQALDAVEQNPTVGWQPLLDAASTPSGIYRNHLQAIWEYLHQDAQLTVAIKRVVMADQPVQLGDDEAFKLHSLGLVKWNKHEVEPRCQLYRLYFRHQLCGNGRQ